jgi:hypothetical protein
MAQFNEEKFVLTRHWLFLAIILLFSAAILYLGTGAPT